MKRAREKYGAKWFQDYYSTTVILQKPWSDVPTKFDILEPAKASTMGKFFWKDKPIELQLKM